MSSRLNPLSVVGIDLNRWPDRAPHFHIPFGVILSDSETLQILSDAPHLGGANKRAPSFHYNTLRISISQRNYSTLS